MLKYYNLCSGSKGNCTIIKADDAQIIIDCGRTKKYLMEKALECNIDILASNALFLTHGHVDHIAAIKHFTSIPIYSSFEIKGVNNEKAVLPFQPIIINHLKITPLPLSHDYENTVGYVVEDDDEKMVIITDTGYVSNENQSYIRNADYYYFESNHDIGMLMNTDRPIYIKNRIASDMGHLCNEDSASILASVIGNKTKQIVLAHLSEQANNPKLAYLALEEQLSNTSFHNISIRVASQNDVTCGGHHD